MYLALFLGGLPAGAETITEPETFPVYDSIRSNVSFWVKIYTEYSTTQGVIHDKRNLNIIYDVIELKDRNHHGSRQINKARIKEVKKKYKQILARLARGETPAGGEERRVAALFGTEVKPVDFQAVLFTPHDPCDLIPGLNDLLIPGLNGMLDGPLCPCQEMELFLCGLLGIDEQAARLFLP